MSFWKWSRTAATNATADATCPFPEGMAPSALNDGIRGAMAALRKFGDDISGAIVTGGTSTAYTVSSYQGFGSLALMSGQMIAFTPNATNGATVTLNVDGLGAKPLRTSTGVELLAGTLIAGTPYIATYNNGDAAWYLHGFFGNPYNIPLGGSLLFFGTTAPNSAFVLPYGQAISRTTYSPLFSLFGTTYGSGDGSTTFNVPDLRGRVPVGQDDMGGSAASRVTTAGGGLDGATLGAVGGAQNVTLAVNQIPAGVPSSNASQSISVTVNTASSRPLAAAPVGDSVSFAQVITGSGVVAPATSLSGQWSGITSLSGSTNNSISVASTNVSQSATKTVPPAIVCNYIMRIA